MNMKNYYKSLLLFCAFANTFILSIFLILIFSFYEQFVLLVVLFNSTSIFIALVETILIKFYSNVVIDVEYSDDNVIIVTNKKKYIHSNICFTEVNEDTPNGKTYIICTDSGVNKKYVFLMNYSPFKTHHLDIKSMKKHMPYAIFK